MPMSSPTVIAYAAEKRIAADVAIVIPTYQRPVALRRCLHSIAAGRLRPAQMIIVGRRTDARTRAAIELLREDFGGDLHIEARWVDVPGHLPPIMAGVAAVRRGITVIVDDDVTVAPDWLGRLIEHFAFADVGIVGGRVKNPEWVWPAKLKGRPGTYAWYGRLWGNIGNADYPDPVDVHSVVECNWAWRTDLLRTVRVDSVLNYDDAYAYGVDWAWHARRSGFRIVYDSRAVVWHHLELRSDELDRFDATKRSFGRARNTLYIGLRHLSWPRKLAYLCWATLVGDRSSHGIVSYLVARLSGEQVTGQFVEGNRARIAAVSLWARSLIDRRSGPELSDSVRDGDAPPSQPE